MKAGKVILIALIF